MSDTIGSALKARREQRQLTLAQISEATRIRSHYLQALENDDLSAIPSAAQARGFLGIYAQFLNLDLQALIPSSAPVEQLSKESELPSEPAPASAATARDRISMSSLFARVRALLPRQARITRDSGRLSGGEPPRGPEPADPGTATVPVPPRKSEAGALAEPIGKKKQHRG